VTVKAAASIILELVVDSVMTTMGVILKKEVASAEYSLAVTKGSIFKLYAPAGVNFHASMMFVPAVGNFKLERYLLDNIESAVDEGIRNATDESVPIGTP
jgi:hypothetical protein